MTEPFDLREPQARVRAFNRRTTARLEALIELGSLVIDTAGRTVTRDGEPITLACREFSLLEALLDRRGRPAGLHADLRSRRTDSPRRKAAGRRPALIDLLLSARGKAALIRARLIATFNENDAAVFSSAVGVSRVLRPIALSPMLLLGLDRMKRELFIRQRRDKIVQQQ